VEATPLGVPQFAQKLVSAAIADPQFVQCKKVSFFDSDESITNQKPA
jgi:hypothetical protein